MRPASAATQAFGAALLIALALAGFWWLAQTVVLAALERAAQSESARIAEHGTPFAWRFDDPAAEPPWVAAGSTGIATSERQPAGTRFVLDGPVLDLSLDLDGRVLPWRDLGRARIHLVADAPLRLALLTDRAGTAPFETRLERALDEGVIRLEAELDGRQGAVESQRLRLWLESQRPGPVVTLSQVDLLPAAGPCAPVPAPGCTGERLAITGSTPEALLAQRDRIRAEQPLAVATPDGAPGWLVSAQSAAREGALRWLPPLLAVIACALAFAALLPPQPRPGRAHAARALALAAGLLLLLLSAPLGTEAGAVAGLMFVVALVLPPGEASRWPPSRADLRPLASAAGGALALLVVLAALSWLGDWEPAWRRPGTLEALRYLGWSLLQLLLLQRLILPLATRIAARPRPAAVLAGLLFGLLHLPNLSLMLLTVVIGVLWSRLLQRGVALLPIAVLHALLGLLALLLLPHQLLRSAEVGARFIELLP